MNSKSINITFQLITSGAIALLCSLANVYAQNGDASSEQVSYDYYFLRALSGDAPIGSFSVANPMIRSFNKPVEKLLSSAPRVTVAEPKNNLDGFDNQMLRYLASYYYPLLANSTDRKEFQGDVLPFNNSMQWFGIANDRYHVFAYKDSVVRIMGDISGTARLGSIGENNFDRNNFMLGRLSARAMGTLGDNFGYMIDLSNGQRFNGLPSRIAFTDPTISRTLKFNIESQQYFDRYIGYVQYQSEYLRVRYGRESFGWGFSPIENMVQSRNAPLMDGLMIDVPYKSVRFTSVHAGVDGLDPDGKPIIGKFIATHRLQVDPASWLSLAVSDMIVYSNRGVDFAYLNPLAFFVSTGLGTRQRSDFDNSILAFEMALRPWSGAMLYGTLVADDIDFGTLTDTTVRGNNNKYAFQAGLSQFAMLSSMPLVVTTEYARINPFTFSHRQVANSWSHLGAPIGYSMQPNSDRISLQAKLWLSARNTIQLDMDYTRSGENYLDSRGNLLVLDTVVYGTRAKVPVGNVGGDILRGDGDFLPLPFDIGNRFLRGNVSTMRRVQLTCSTELYPNVFVDARAQYLNRSGGNVPTERFWFFLELRVGY
jgi:hypothetical protein